MKTSLNVIAMSIFIVSTGNAQTPAFPGAEGYAAIRTTGGREGGEVYRVTNTLTSGGGSLPDALSEGDRIIVFTTGGTLDYADELVVLENTTIFGQTAPGGGFQLANTRLTISSSNVIVQGLRVRMGDSDNELDAGARDAITVGSEEEDVRNVIIDHCSAEWGIDECLSVVSGASVVTVSWSIGIVPFLVDFRWRPSEMLTI